MLSTKLTISQHRYLMKIYTLRLVLVLKPKPHKSTISAIRRPEPRKIHEPNKKCATSCDAISKINFSASLSPSSLARMNEREQLFPSLAQTILKCTFRCLESDRHWNSCMLERTRGGDSRQKLFSRFIPHPWEVEFCIALQIFRETAPRLII